MTLCRRGSRCGARALVVSRHFLLACALARELQPLCKLRLGCILLFNRHTEPLLALVTG
jgi:hypothetical protein